LNTSSYEPERFRSPEYLAVLDQHPSDLHFNIPAHCLEKLRQYAAAGYPQEICGLLIGTFNERGWDIQDVRPVANLNQERATDRFQLDPAGYQAMDRELRGTGVEIIGVYHSHPDCPAKPSPTDLDSAWEGFAYPIISVCDGNSIDLCCWAINDAGTAFQSISIEESQA